MVEGRVLMVTTNGVPRMGASEIIGSSTCMHPWPERAGRVAGPPLHALCSLVASFWTNHRQPFASTAGFCCQVQFRAVQLRTSGVPRLHHMPRTVEGHARISIIDDVQPQKFPIPYSAIVFAAHPTTTTRQHNRPKRHPQGWKAGRRTPCHHRLLSGRLSRYPLRPRFVTRHDEAQAASLRAGCFATGSRIASKSPRTTTSLSPPFRYHRLYAQFQNALVVQR